MPISAKSTSTNQKTFHKHLKLRIEKKAQRLENPVEIDLMNNMETNRNIGTFVFVFLGR